MTTPALSDEQLKVVKSVRDNNVIVDSVAGSGKTTTALAIVKAYPNRKFLLITYNTRLRQETKQRVKEMGEEISKRVDIHTYHSFGYANYRTGCHVDKDILSIIRHDYSPIRGFKYNTIIIDEAQDMSETYFLFCKKIMKDNQSDEDRDINICVFGDMNQSIFKFNSADERFIIYADKIYSNNSTLPWVRCPISTSYRITKPMAHFLNECALGYERIHAVKDGDPVQYIVCNTFSDRPYTTVSRLLKKYNVEDVFILAPSVKSIKSPVRKLANKLCQVDNIPIFVPNSDDDRLDPELLRNKLVFSTFHQVKGLERKVVVVMGCDDSYYSFFGKTEKQTVCPNIFYVAFTRAKEQLVIIHHDDNQYLPFLNTKSLLKPNDSWLVMTPIKPYKTFIEIKEATKFCVTDIVRHLSMKVIMECMRYIKKRKINEKSTHIDIPSKIKGDTVESVSDITGTAIVAFFEKSKGRDITISKPFLSTGAKVPTDTISDVLLLANQYNSKVSDYIYKLMQIKTYNWLTQSNLDKCVERLQETITSKKLEFERFLTYKFGDENQKVLTGSIDCISNSRTVWEIKCVQELEDIHFVQVVLYGLLIESGCDKKMDYRYRLYNILTNELYSVRFKYTDAVSMLLYLVQCKSGKGVEEMTDEQFLDKYMPHI